MSAVKPLWEPSQARIESALVTRFAREAIRDWRLELNDYPAFYRWSADHPEQFWQSVWRHCGVRGDPGQHGSSRTATGCRARSSSPTAGSTSPRTSCGAATRPTR